MTEYVFVLALNYTEYRKYIRDNCLFPRTHIYLDDEYKLRGVWPIKILCIPGWHLLQDNHRILAFARNRGAEILEIEEQGADIL